MDENSGNDIVTTKEMTLHMGPQHPSSHGVLHLLIDMQGERVLNVEPDIGYLHRGTEKIAENLLYHQFVPYTDRLDYMCAMSNNLAYVQAVEKLLSIEIPERAKYIRVIAAELSRIAGHIIGVGAWAVDLGAMSVFLYAVRERGDGARHIRAALRRAHDIKLSEGGRGEVRVHGRVRGVLP